MIIRIALLLAAGLMLGSCCLSGNCYAPVTGVAATPGVPMSGVPTAGVPNVCARRARGGIGRRAASRRSTRQTEKKPPSAEEISNRWARRPRRPDIAATAMKNRWPPTRRDEARLKRKLIICQNCSSSGKLRRPSRPVTLPASPINQPTFFRRCFPHGSVSAS